jgi:hypothetical protein
MCLVGKSAPRQALTTLTEVSPLLKQALLTIPEKAASRATYDNAVNAREVSRVGTGDD